MLAVGGDKLRPAHSNIFAIAYKLALALRAIRKRYIFTCDRKEMKKENGE